MTEQWKAIPDHPEYQVSNNGRIRSMDRLVKCGKGKRLVVGRVLRPQVAKNTGYFQVDLSGHRKTVHRIVALAWCPGNFYGAVVDHLNSNRTDNRACNLEWVTHRENIRRGRTGETKQWAGKYSSAHPTSKAVISTCLQTKQETFWPSGMDAVRAGFDGSSISRACRGQIASHAGHLWRFSEPVPEWVTA